jgi:protein-tyrosine-phosphatase
MNIYTLSVGLFAYPSSWPDPIMGDYLSKSGIPVERHEAKQITKEPVGWVDLILVMEKGHARMIEESWP